MSEITGIRFRNYKSFKNEYAEIPINRITVLIGRNNCGKSSCIDIIEALKNTAMFRGQNSELLIDVTLDADDLPEHEQHNLNRTFLCEPSGSKIDFTEVDSNGNFISSGIWRCRFLNEFIEKMRILRLNAERDILPEPYTQIDKIVANGDGACNLINCVLNHKNYDETLVQRDLLEALNQIMHPDSVFDGITVQKIDSSDDGKWEIFLYEGGERFPLSQTGSGLKTIILVLLNLLVIPNLNHSKFGYYNENTHNVFAFEELENNLHPALQRRLFDYIYQYCQEHKNAHIYLTTHSHVAINAFADKPNTQILHVIKENGISTVRRIEDFISKNELLNDLDVRASDLLQANGIIWIEGPSDRVYIKRWLKIFGGSELTEGRDYQFLYYGGRLLSHYTASEAEEETELIKILTTNRNSAIVIDSDKRSRRASINDTKKRIKNEFDSLGLFCWITKGKEIENYVEYQAINGAYNSHLSEHCGQYELFPDYIKSVRHNFTNEKVAFSNKVSVHITQEHAETMLDLKKMITTLIATIQSWNP